MKSNTIRLEEPLLRELYPLLSGNQSLASFVRGVLQKEILRHKQKAAAKKYVEFLFSDAEERALLKEWEAADLVSSPAPAYTTKRKRPAASKKKAGK